MLVNNLIISQSVTLRLTILSIIVLLPQSLLQATAQITPTDGVVLTTTISSASPQTSSILHPTTSAQLDPSALSEATNFLPTNITQAISNATQSMSSNNAIVGVENPYALANVTVFNDKLIEQLFVKKDYSVKGGPNCTHVQTASADTNSEGIWWTCPPGFFCVSPNASSLCPPGYWCPTNTSQPLYCCGGYYCSNDTTTMTICPAGYYCPIGVIQPIPCTLLLSSCPPGTVGIQNTGIAVIVAAFIVVSLIVFALKNRSDNMQRAKYERLINDNYLAKKKYRQSGLLSTNTVERSFDVEFSNLSLTLPNGVEIMKGVSGTLKAGRTCAIMGPSGAGKTTFISLLTGKLRKTSGVIRVNGVEEPLYKYKKLIGFVPQEDIMMRELSVRDNLTFSAMMRLPRKMSHAEKCQKVLNTIKFLGLSHVMNNAIGDERTRGISGGQRKRVNIGMELVADPSILFLDEPTSGLDSTTSLEVCTLLHDIARKQQMTIAAVVHSPGPRCFDQFDDLLLLGKGGQIVYFGPRVEASEYFTRIGFPRPPGVSHADHYISVTSDKVQSEIDARFALQDLYVYWNNHIAGRPLVVPSRTVSVDIEGKMGREQLRADSRASTADRPLLGDYEQIKADTESFFVSTASVPKRRLDISEMFLHFFSNLGAVIRDLSWWVWDTIEEFQMWLLDILLFFRSDPVRDTPNVFRVFWLCFKRALVQIYINKSKFFLDSLLHIGCGLFISIAVKDALYLGKQPEDICAIAPGVLLVQCSNPIDYLPQVGVFLSLGVLFAGIASGSSTFGSERVVFWRDTSAGMPALPYYIAKAVADIPRILVSSFLFTMTFILFFDYRSALYGIFAIVLLVYTTAFGMGYLISLLFQRDLVALVGTGFSLAWGMVFSGQDPDLTVVVSDPFFHYWTWVWTISAPRWAVEAIYLKEVAARPFAELHNGQQLAHTYAYADYIPAILNLVYISIGWNVLAFLALKLTHRDKQK